MVIKWLLGAAVLGVLVCGPAADAVARAGGGTSTGGSSSGGGYGSTHYYYGARGGQRSPARMPASAPHMWLFGAVAIGLLFLVNAGTKAGTRSGGGAPGRLYDRADGQTLLTRIAGEDEGWNQDHLRARVEEVYLRVQQAWTERNQELAKDFMSPRLYAKHKRQTDEMLARGVRNVLEEIRLLDCEIVHIADRKGTHDDEFWAVITGSLIDYEVRDGAKGPAVFSLHDAPEDDRLAQLVQQQMRPAPTRFRELWKFVRDDRGWVLDKIEQDLAAGLEQARMFSLNAP